MKTRRFYAGIVLGFLLVVPVASGQGFRTEKTRVEYTHTSARGNPCRFELGPKGGKADFYWDGRRRREKLEPAGQVAGKDNIYNVYKVVGKDFWFFFAVNAVGEGDGKDYPMRYSLRSKELEGSTPIATRGPTRVRTFEIKD